MGSRSQDCVDAGDARNSDDPNAAASFIATSPPRSSARPQAWTQTSAPASCRSSRTCTALSWPRRPYSAQQVYSKNLELFGTNVTNDINEVRQLARQDEHRGPVREDQARDAAGRLEGVANDDSTRPSRKPSLRRLARSAASLLVAQSYDKIGNNPKYLGIFRAAQDSIETKALASETRAIAMEQRNIRIAGERALMGVFNGLTDQMAKGSARR